MRKTVFLLVLMLLLSLFSNARIVYGSQTIEELVEEANQEILALYGEANYYDFSQVNISVYNDYEVFVYGSPHGDIDSKGEYRYLGYTPTGEPFPNYKMERDSDSGVPFNNLNWISNPWDDFRVIAKYGIRENTFDVYRANMLDHFKGAMERYSSDRYINNDITTPWDTYYHVIAPPTKNTHGSVWLWHTSNSGSLWYMTSALLPTKYVHPIMDTVSIEYHNLNGQELLPKELDSPSSIGILSYQYKPIEGYECLNESIQVNIQMNGTIHNIVFKYNAIGEELSEKPVEPEKPAPPSVYVPTHRTIYEIYKPDPNTPNFNQVKVTYQNQGHVVADEHYKLFSPNSPFDAYVSHDGYIYSCYTVTRVVLIDSTPEILLSGYELAPWNELIGGDYSQYLSPKSKHPQPDSTIGYMYHYKPVNDFSWYYKVPVTELLIEFYDNGMSLSMITDLVREYKNHPANGFSAINNEWITGYQYYDIQTQTGLSDSNRNIQLVYEAIRKGLD